HRAAHRPALLGRLRAGRRGAGPWRCRDGRLPRTRRARARILRPHLRTHHGRDRHEPRRGRRPPWCGGRIATRGRGARSGHVALHAAARRIRPLTAVQCPVRHSRALFRPRTNRRTTMRILALCAAAALAFPAAASASEPAPLPDFELYDAPLYASEVEYEEPLSQRLADPVVQNE